MAKGRLPSGRKKFEPKDVKGFITLGGTFVQFHEDGKVEAKGSLSADEMAAMAHINELLRRLRTGKVITYDFDPLAFQDGERLVSCEWLPSGNLKLNMDDKHEQPRPVNKRWDHAYTIAEAMGKHRTFTCSLNLYMMLPRRRAPREQLTDDELNGDTDTLTPTEEALLASQADVEAGRTRPVDDIIAELKLEQEMEGE